MSTSYGRDLTAGSVPRTLLRQAVPIFLSYILFSGYSVVNTIWIGRLMGGDALAAVAVSIPVVMLLLALASAMGMAAAVLVAQAFGAKRADVVTRVVNTCYPLTAIIALCIAAVGMVGTGALLSLLNTPIEAFGLAEGYLRLSFIGFVFTSIQLLVNSTLRAVGNTRTPLLITLFSTALNAVLDPLLMIGIGPFPRLGLNGAALATILCSATGAALAFAYVKVKHGHSPLSPTGLTLDRAVISQLARVGFPTFAQKLIFFVGSASVIGIVNGFGARAAGAFGAAGRVDSFVVIPSEAMLFAITTITAQLIGAGKTERVKEVFAWGLVFNTPILLAVAVLTLSFPELVMRTFVNDASIVGIGAGYFRIMGFAYLTFILSYVSNGVIIGAKKAAMSMFAGFVTVCVLRVPMAVLLSRVPTLGLAGIWTAMMASSFAGAMVSFVYYLSGRWKRRPVQLPAEAAPLLGRMLAGRGER
jgi:putative MATE family efflux protein